MFDRVSEKYWLGVTFDVDVVAILNCTVTVACWKGSPAGS